MTTTQNLISEKLKIIDAIDDLECQDAPDEEFRPLYDRLFEIDAQLAKAGR